MGLLEVDEPVEILDEERLGVFMDALGFLDKKNEEEKKREVREVWAIMGEKGVSKRGLKMILSGIYNVWQP